MQGLKTGNTKDDSILHWLLYFRSLVQIFNPIFVPLITGEPACNVFLSTIPRGLRLCQNIAVPNFGCTSSQCTACPFSSSHFKSVHHSCPSGRHLRQPILRNRKVSRRTLSSLHFGCGGPVGPVSHWHHDYAQSFRRILELWVQHRRRAGQIGAPC